MYTISHEEYYQLYDVLVDEIIDYFYSKDELIKFIAKYYSINEWIDDGFKYHKDIYNPFIEKCTCDLNELVELSWGCYYRRYVIYDNFNRIINIHDFKDDALNLYQKQVKEGKNNTYSLSTYNLWLWLKRSPTRSRKYNFLRRMDFNYEYRKDPVPHTRKIRGGGRWSPPHTAKIKRMYNNPEYKEFNRGSKKEVPDWWDDRTRCVQRSWKEQSKARHQWQRGRLK